MTTFIDCLTPPTGTSFFKREEIKILDYQKRPDHGEVLWSASLYKYCTGAAPTDPDFQKKGGAIVLVFVHHGFLHDSSDDWRAQVFSTEFDIQESQLLRVLPMSLTSNETTGFKSHINQTNFQMDLPMYKNRGHESFIFPAKFQESFVRVPKTWNLGFESENGAVFGFYKEAEDKPLSAHVPVRALIVIKCYDPTKTLKISEQTPTQPLLFVYPEPPQNGPLLDFRHYNQSISGKEQNKLSRKIEIKLSEF